MSDAEKIRELGILRMIEELKILFMKRRELFVENNKDHTQFLDEALKIIMKLQEKELEKNV